MSYIPPQEVEKIRSIDLLTYLQKCEPEQLVHVSGNTYTTAGHDSLRISNGMWHWFSQNIGGKSALDYLIKVRGMSFMQAAKTIQYEFRSTHTPSLPSPHKSVKKTLLLPKKHTNCDQVTAYLKHRGIDAEIIDFCINTGRLYESSPHHNAVFVGFDLQGNRKYANLRGTAGDFKGEATGSDKRYSFSIPAENSHTLHIFESAIDLLSYATLQKLDKKDWTVDHLLSLAGVFRMKQGGTIPLALQQCLTDYPEIQQIHLRLDRDATGREATAGISVKLRNNYEIRDYPPTIGKDYNDQLRNLLRNSKHRIWGSKYI